MELHNTRANSFSFTEVLISYKQSYSMSRFCSHVLKLQIFYRLLDIVFCIKEMLSRANSFRKFRHGKEMLLAFHCLLLKFSFVHKRSFFSTFSCVFRASAFPSALDPGCLCKRICVRLFLFDSRCFRFELRLWCFSL